MGNSAVPAKIGLALGSGASRGWSHIGVLKALLKAGIEPDVICGASVGAMIGASYLTGNLQKLEDWVLGSTRKDVLKFFKIKFSQSGFVDIDRLKSFLHDYVAGEDHRIEDLDIPFAALATNLETGKEAWLQRGNLAEAVRASMALPGLFAPVRENGRWLVDGGLVNPVPVTTCHALGADIVIAVNLNSDIVRKHERKKAQPGDDDSDGVLSNIKQTAREYSINLFSSEADEDEYPGYFALIANSINIVQDRITRSRMAGDPADVLISPKLAHIGLLEFSRADEAIAEGERCVEQAMAHIRATIGNA